MMHLMEPFEFQGAPFFLPYLRLPKDPKVTVRPIRCHKRLLFWSLDGSEEDQSFRPINKFQ